MRHALLALTLVMVGCSSSSSNGAAGSGTVDPGAETPAAADPAAADPAAADPTTTDPGSGQPQGFNHEDQEGACRSTERPTRFTCQWDSDCVVCHDGSDCGVVVNQQELTRRGAECELPDAAECEYSRPRCCSGRCARASY